MIPAMETSWLWGLIGDDDAAALWSPQEQTTGMLAFEAALTEAMGQAGLAEASEAARIGAEIRAFVPDLAAIQGAVAKDGVPVAELVRQLRANSTGDAKLIHTGCTSQDVVDTATVLILRNVSELASQRLNAVIAALSELEERFGDYAMMGRTRMQAALPISVRDRIEPWRLALQEHAADLAPLRGKLERLQYGGAVGNRAAHGAHAGAIAAAMADTLDLGNPPRSWQAMRGNLVAYGQWMTVLSGTLGKIGQDMALMAQQGIGEVALSGGGGSSAMPHKQNPVLAELLVTLARFTAGQSGMLAQSMVHEQERSGTAWTLEWMVLPQICMATCRGLSATQEMLSRIDRLGEA